MSLGRTPLLYEAEPALKYEAGIGNVPAGHWGADPRKKSKPVFSMPLGLSSTDDARTKTTSSWHVKVPQSRSQTQIIRPSIGAYSYLSLSLDERSRAESRSWRSCERPDHRQGQQKTEAFSASEGSGREIPDQLPL